MSLIKSISGIRGTIGGQPGTNLTPVDIVECTAGFATFLKSSGNRQRVVVGRDARISGPIVSQLVIQTLLSYGFDVVDLGLSTTPTVEMAVVAEKAGGGIVITASHNPKEWNALKFLNEKGEFISAEDGNDILKLISDKAFEFSGVDQLGKQIPSSDYFDYHIEKILALPYVDKELIRSKNFKVVVDPVNSTGSLILNKLLAALNCTVEMIHNDLSGNFAHNPEPLPAHLEDLCKKVIETGADIGIAVDPDVDRLALVNEDGSLFGEEYTLVAAADFLLSKKSGNTVSNLSSTRALADITHRYGGQYFAAAVGEVHVVNKMKEVAAVIGGEGNGGVILPDLHYGRDAVAGVVLILNLMAESRQTLLQIKANYPHYEMVKEKIELTPEIDVDKLLQHIESVFSMEKINTVDGVKIDFEDGWVHLRKSNTEPIIRIYAEGKTKANAYNRIQQVKGNIK